jgi:RimJ/RimL family protein N-acetyltransferase
MDGQVTLRPVTEADLVPMARFSLEPEALGEFEWTGFTDPKARRRRWEDDGLLGDDSSMLAVVLPDGTFAGFVIWRNATQGVARAAPRRPSTVVRFDIGIALLPEYRQRGYGTEAQRLLDDYLFATTTVHRISAGTEGENMAEQRALEKVGFRREGVMRSVGYRAGRWVDGVMYGLLRDDERPRADL